MIGERERLRRKAHAVEPVAQVLEPLALVA
jgi:hypothetical protein